VRGEQADVAQRAERFDHAIRPNRDAVYILTCADGSRIPCLAEGSAEDTLS